MTKAERAQLRLGAIARLRELRAECTDETKAYRLSRSVIRLRVRLAGDWSGS